MKYKKYIAIVMATVSLTLLNVVSPVAVAHASAAQTKAEEALKDNTEEVQQEEKTEQKEEEKEQNKDQQATQEDQQESQQDQQEEKEQAKDQQTTQEDQQATQQDQVQEEQAQAEEEPVLTEEELAAKEKEEARKALQNDPNHVHNYKWIAKMNASEVAEGTMNYMCEECGKIWFFSPASPYVCFEGDTAHRIATAAEGERINVKTSHFINFDKQVMKALADRPDVSLYVSFLDGEYKGNRVSFVIPAGEDTMALLDENGYCGFKFLGGKYGLTLEQAAEVAEPAEGEQAAEAAEKTENAEESVSRTEEVGTQSE